MIKIIKNMSIFFICTLIIFLFFANTNIIISSVKYSVNIFFTNVLPSLLPFFILADFLINYNYVYFLNSIFKFKYSHIILLSLFSGLPSNAKYIKEMLDNKLITRTDASIMCSVTFFPNPMFVIGSVGFLLLKNIKLGIVLLIICYLSNLIVYLFYYKKLNNKNNMILKKPVNPFNLLKTSILNNTSTLVIILGTIVIFTTLSNVIFNYIKVNLTLSSFISALVEMSSGIIKISSALPSTSIKFILIGTSLGFSSFSILAQAFSILSDYKLNVKLIIKNKLIITFFCFIICYIYSIFCI